MDCEFPNKGEAVSAQFDQPCLRSFSQPTFGLGQNPSLLRRDIHVMLHSHDNLRLLNLNIYLKTDREFPNGPEVLSAIFFQIRLPASHLRTRTRLSFCYTVSILHNYGGPCSYRTSEAAGFGSTVAVPSQNLVRYQIRRRHICADLLDVLPTLQLRHFVTAAGTVSSACPM